MSGADLADVKGWENRGGCSGRQDAKATEQRGEASQLVRELLAIMHLKHYMRRCFCLLWLASSVAGFVLEASEELCPRLHELAHQVHSLCKFSLTDELLFPFTVLIICNGSIPIGLCSQLNAR